MTIAGPPLLLVFARAPVAGRVKTRLVPLLGEAGAAHLYRQLLANTLTTAAQLAPITPELWWDAAPDPADDSVGMADRYGMAQRLQRGNDLGERMADALLDALRRAPTAALIGSDCPGCDAAYLRSAFDALAAHDAVIGPAADGGYVLIGLRRMDPRVFTDVAWGSDRVLACTRRRFAALRWRWHELPVRHDVDRPEDLSHYPELLAGIVPEEWP